MNGSTNAKLHSCIGSRENTRAHLAPVEPLLLQGYVDCKMHYTVKTLFSLCWVVACFAMNSGVKQNGFAFTIGILVWITLTCVVPFRFNLRIRAAYALWGLLVFSSAFFGFLAQRILPPDEMDVGILSFIIGFISAILATLLWCFLPNDLETNEVADN